MNMKRKLIRLIATALALLTLGAAVCMVNASAATGDGAVTVIQQALRMPVGATQKLDVSGKTAGGAAVSDFTYTSSKTSVAVVSNQGVITAKGVGHADITVHSSKADAFFTVSVDVYDPAKEQTKEEFRISVFWGPTWDYTNDEQYDLLADAGINWVMMPGDAKLNGKEGIFKAAKLCYDRGIHLIGIDYGSVSGRADTTKAMWESFRDTYQYCAGLGGIFLADEPMNANPYADDYRYSQEVWPGFYSHLNFLPSSVYGSSDIYKRQLDDFVNLVGADKYQYLMFDRYPFAGAAGNFDPGIYTNLNDLRLVGLRNQVKTAAYVQSIGNNGGLRRPTGTEINFNVNICLAYGVKMFRYFTWFQPTGQGETFTTSIVDANGKPTDLYESVKTTNAHVMNWGPTLMKVDALEVYHGTGSDGPRVPKDFFAIPTAGKNVLLSFMRDRETGRNYLMVVNKSFTKKQTTTLSFDTAIASLQQISYEDGKLYNAPLDNHTLTLELAPGDASLFVLPEGYDWYKAPAAPQKGENLAADCQVSGTYSDGDSGAGLYLWNLTDGVLKKQKGNSGWRAVGSKRDQEASVTINLGAIRTVDRVDLFPAGEGESYGIDFPRDFSIEVSADGQTWETAVSVTGFETALPSFTFPARQAQYVRLHITAMRQISRTYQASLAEIQVFEDDGHTSAIVPFNQSLLDLMKLVEETDTSMASADRKKVLDDAVKKALAVSADGNATLDAIKQALNELQDALNNLLSPNQRVLKEIIDVLEALEADARAELEIDLLVAQRVYSDPEASEDALKAAVTRAIRALQSRYTLEELNDNIAAKKNNPTIIYSSNLWDSYEALGWSWKFINDGTTNLWSSELLITDPNNTEWIGYKFAEPEVFDTVVIVPRGGGIDFPTHWILEYSQDGENWVTILEDQHCDNKGETVTLTFEPVMAKYIRFFGVKLKNGGDGYALQLSEMEVYRAKDATVFSTDALPDAIAAAEAVNTEPYSAESVARLTAAIERAKALLTAEAPTQAQVEKALDDLVWAAENLTEPEPETEPPTEPETEPATEPMTDPVDTTATEAVSTGEDSVPSTESGTEATVSKGCASALSALSLVALSAASAALLCRKKREDA